jgi:hypothetical protein
MPVCITGMHRSGTSLVANLLRLCGLYLGEEQDLMPATTDNESGYWENEKIRILNDQILRELGGTWDFPPVAADGWAESERFTSLRVKAETLLQEFRDHEPWGWKDPRSCLTLSFWANLNSLTVPFWYGFGSQLKVVLCIRNPFEVFHSLGDRKYAPNSAGLNLWRIYNQGVIGSTLREDRVVTHYEAYFHDALSELRRVLNFLEMSVSEEVVERAVFAVSDKLRHQKVDAEHILDEVASSDVFSLYQELCTEANYVESSGVGK